MSSAYINFRVQVVFIEIFAFVFNLFSLSRRIASNIQFPRIASLQVLTSLLFAWASYQFFLDAYLNADKFESLKSIANIIALASLLIFMKNTIIYREKRLNSFLVGYTASSILTFFFFPNDYSHDHPWKFCFGFLTTALILWKLQAKSNRVNIILLVGFILILIDFRENARSLAVITVLSIALWIYNLNSKKANVFYFLIALILLTSYSEKIYLQLAQAGVLGGEVARKTELQAQNGPLLLVARSELLYELEGIKNSPLWGSGSSPRANYQLLNSVWNLEKEYEVNSKGTAAFIEYKKSSKIPQHSMLFGSWLEGGIVGAVPWFFIIYLLIKWLNLARKIRSRHDLLMHFLIVNALWAILFSPLGSGSRLSISLVLVVGFHLYETQVPEVIVE